MFVFVGNTWHWRVTQKKMKNSPSAYNIRVKHIVTTSHCIISATRDIEEFPNKWFTSCSVVTKKSFVRSSGTVRRNLHSNIVTLRLIYWEVENEENGSSVQGYFHSFFPSSYLAYLLGLSRIIYDWHIIYIVFHNYWTI